MQMVREKFFTLMERCNERERRALEGFMLTKDKAKLNELLKLLVKKYGPL